MDKKKRREQLYIVPEKILHGWLNMKDFFSRVLLTPESNQALVRFWALWTSRAGETQLDSKLYGWSIVILERIKGLTLFRLQTGCAGSLDTILLLLLLKM